MNAHRHVFLSAFAAVLLLLSACNGGRQQTKSFVNVLTADDSVNIAMGQWVLTKFHSDKLSLDINYPSFLQHQDVPEEMGLQEVFVWEDVSISIDVDSMNSDHVSGGQMMMNMGAELLEATDRYSIHLGYEGDWEYYGKVIDDSLRLVSVILRYSPDHTEAMEPLRAWVHEYDTK